MTSSPIADKTIAGVAAALKDNVPPRALRQLVTALQEVPGSATYREIIERVRDKLIAYGAL